MTIDDKRAIITYRIQKSSQVMIEARDNAKLGHWSLVANRLYYALFHAGSALVLDKGYTIKSHSGLICLLGQEFVIKGLLTKDDAKLVSRLFNMRQTGDYDDFDDWDEQDVFPLIEKTERLLDKINSLLVLNK